LWLTEFALPHVEGKDGHEPMPEAVVESQVVFVVVKSMIEAIKCHNHKNRSGFDLELRIIVPSQNCILVPYPP
jgi:hypothetical protein